MRTQDNPKWHTVLKTRNKPVAVERSTNEIENERTFEGRIKTVFPNLLGNIFPDIGV